MDEQLSFDYSSYGADGIRLQGIARTITQVNRTNAENCLDIASKMIEVAEYMSDSAFDDWCRKAIKYAPAKARLLMGLYRQSQKEPSLLSQDWFQSEVLKIHPSPQQLDRMSTRKPPQRIKPTPPVPDPVDYGRIDSVTADVVWHPEAQPTSTQIDVPHSIIYPGQPEYPMEADSPAAMIKNYRLSPNRSGASAEESVGDILDRLGFPYILGKKRQGRGIGILGESITPDFFVMVSNQKFPNGFCLEVKQGYELGSLQRHALYYLVNNSVNYTCPVFIVCQGKGMTTDKIPYLGITALEWAKKQAEQRQAESSGTAKLKDAIDIDTCRQWLEALKIATKKKTA